MPIPTSRLDGFPEHKLDDARNALAKAHARLCRAAVKSRQIAPSAPTLVVTREPYVVSHCRRCGCTSHGWTCTQHGCSQGPVISITLVDVEVTGERPVLAGWDFLACVEPLEGSNLIRQVPGAAIANGELTPWREGAIRCDHCGTSRRRTETFIVRADGSDPAVAAGTYKQVGRNCLEAFLGGKSAAAIIAMLGWSSIIHGAAGDEDEGGGWFSHAPKIHDPSVFLGWVCGVIREDGWLSRGAARDGDRTSTSDQAMYLMDAPWGGGDVLAKWHKERERCAPGVKGLERAAASLSWARALNPTNDYEYNLALVARQLAMKPSHAGILASAVHAHTRALGSEAARSSTSTETSQPSTHVGKVGQRLDLELTVERAIETVSDFGALNILVMRDAHNNSLFVWKTGVASAKPGEQLKVRATVKRHSEWKGEKQTYLTRGTVFDEWPTKTPRKPRAKKAKAPIVERWHVGDEVSFAASPSAYACRTVYTGIVERIDQLIAYVRAQEGHLIGVSLCYLHTAGAYEILQAGPRGILWTDAETLPTRGSPRHASAVRACAS